MQPMLKIAYTVVYGDGRFLQDLRKVNKSDLGDAKRVTISYNSEYKSIRRVEKHQIHA